MGIPEAAWEWFFISAFVLDLFERSWWWDVLASIDTCYVMICWM